MDARDDPRTATDRADAEPAGEHGLRQACPQGARRVGARRLSAREGPAPDAQVRLGVGRYGRLKIYRSPAMNSRNTCTSCLDPSTSGVLSWSPRGSMSRILLAPLVAAPPACSKRYAIGLAS